MNTKWQIENDDDLEEVENVYKQNGYADRDEYLHSLAEDFDVPFVTVKYLADMLGPNEDFDGLVTELEDYADQMDFE